MLRPPSIKVLRAKEVAEKLSCSLSTVYALVEKDSSFPKSIRLTNRWCVWMENEIDDWLISRIAAAREESESTVLAKLQMGEARLQKNLN